MNSWDVDSSMKFGKKTSLGSTVSYEKLKNFKMTAVSKIATKNTCKLHLFLEWMSNKYIPIHLSSKNEIILISSTTKTY